MRLKPELILFLPLIIIRKSEVFDISNVRDI